jgi:hypothetical protein
MAQPPNLDTFAKKEAYRIYQAEQGKGQKSKKPKAPPPPANDGIDEEDLPENEKANRNIYEPGSIGEQNYLANRVSAPGTVGVPYQGPGATEYPGASDFVKAALKKKPADRTSAEKAALSDRSRAEEIALKRGQRLAGGGISKDLIAQDVGAQAGRREATAAVAFHDASEQTLAEAGRGPKGEKLSAPGSGGYSPPVLEGGQDDRPAPGSPGITHTGFAMRTLADGTVRGASPDGNGGTTLRNFGTQAEALAFYRPVQPAPAVPPVVPPGMDWRSQAARMSIGQPMQLEATPQVQPPAAAPVSATQPAVVPPAPTSVQTAEAAKTTAPTTKLEMNAPAPAATPPTVQPAPAAAPAPAPVQAAAPVPTNPFSGQTVSPSLATPLPGGKGFDLMPGIEALRARDAARLSSTNREMGTPKRTGYQMMADELNPYGN